MKMLMGMVLVLTLASTVGCSSTKVKRTIESDPQMRVLLDPRIPVGHYVQIRKALVRSGKFEVVDRRDGFEAALREQDLQFRSGYSDRFSDREKWAHVGALYGAGAVVTASAECYEERTFWGEFIRSCNQDLAFIDGRTGSVILEVSGKSSTPWTANWITPSWDSVVKKVVSEYPEYFQPRVAKHPLVEYMDQSEELSKREKAKREPALITPYVSKTDLKLLQEANKKVIEEGAEE